MKISEALQILDIDNNDIEINQEIIKRAYRVKIRVYHPDRNPAGSEMSKIINLAYEFLKTISSFEDITFNDDNRNYSSELANVLNTIKSNTIGVKIEICGLWAWFSGDTKPYKDILKAQECKWSNNKKCWYYKPVSETKNYKFKRKSTSMDDIRSMHGSQGFSNFKAHKKIA